MTLHLPNDGVLIIVLVACIPAAWYVYQILSRATAEVGLRVRRVLVGIPVYLITATTLHSQGIPILEAVAAGGFAGLGAIWLFVKRPNRNRRIPKRMRAKVIERDLTSKGLAWDATKYHIDHIVPFSRGGDTSIRNLRVTEKHKNLSKGNKMPRFRDFR